MGEKQTISKPTCGSFCFAALPRFCLLRLTARHHPLGGAASAGAASAGAGAGLVWMDFCVCCFFVSRYFVLYLCVCVFLCVFLNKYLFQDVSRFFVVCWLVGFKVLFCVFKDFSCVLFFLGGSWGALLYFFGFAFPTFFFGGYIFLVFSR